ncbi:MAG: hypothetical protein ACKN83_09870 [Vulcanococcus sp.]
MESAFGRLTRLQSWADLRGGWELFDSSTGFRLADGSVLSPAAAAVRPEAGDVLPELVLDLEEIWAA